MDSREMAWACLLILALVCSPARGDSLQISIDPSIDKDAMPVPSGFMGLSLEPVSKAGYYADDVVFQQLLKNLVAYRTGAFNIRWGGHTQDDDPTPLEESAWTAMTDLYEVSGRKITFTIPIALRTGNVSTAKAQIQSAIDEGLPGDAVYAINIGNEPDAYTFRYDKKQFPDNFMMTKYWDQTLEIMEAIADMTDGWLKDNKIFSGPAVASRKEFPVNRVRQWAEIGKNKPGSPYTKLVTWHYYVANAKKDDATIETLLDDGKAQHIRTQVKAYASEANKVGLQFRLDETNSISHSGKIGVSNTAAAALWLVDHSLSLMQAGAAGINVHTAGCSPYSPVLFPGTCKDPSITDQLDKFEKMCPEVCGQEDAIAMVNAPYYGIWFMQKVLRNHANVTLLPANAITVGAHKKTRIYVLKSPKQLRVVLINLRDSSAGNTEVQLSLPGENAWGFGTVMRLTGGGELVAEAEELTLAGQQVDPTGLISGPYITCKLEPKATEGKTQFMVQLPPASATVVVIPTAQGRQAEFAQVLAEGLDQNELCANQD